jgi:hypothetical protein
MEGAPLMLACSRFSQTGSDTANARRVAIDWTSTSRSSPRGDAKRGGVGARTHAPTRTHARPQKSHNPTRDPLLPSAMPATVSCAQQHHSSGMPLTFATRTWPRVAPWPHTPVSLHLAVARKASHGSHRASSGGGTWNLNFASLVRAFFGHQGGVPSEAECGSSVRSCGA